LGTDSEKTLTVSTSGSLTSARRGEREQRESKVRHSGARTFFVFQPRPRSLDLTWYQVLFAPKARRSTMSSQVSAVKEEMSDTRLARRMVFATKRGRCVRSVGVPVGSNAATQWSPAKDKTT
jgi:hypothetical protein